MATGAVVLPPYERVTVASSSTPPAARMRKTRRTIIWAARKNRIRPWRRSIIWTGNAGLDLHQAGPGAHGTEQQAGEHDADRVGPREQRHGDRVEADVGRVGGRHVALHAQDLDRAGQPAEQPADGERQHDQQPRPHARVARRIRVCADGPDLEAQRAAEEEPPDDRHRDERAG